MNSAREDAREAQKQVDTLSKEKKQMEVHMKKLNDELETT